MNVLATQITYPTNTSATGSLCKVPAPISYNYHNNWQWGLEDYYTQFDANTPLPVCPLCKKELHIEDRKGLFVLSHNPKCAIKVWGIAESKSQIRGIWNDMINKVKGI